MSEFNHRYPNGSSEHTAVLPPYQPYRAPDSLRGPQPPQRRRPVGLLMGALVLGVVGGVAGAAGFDAADGVADGNGTATRTLAPLQTGDAEASDSSAPPGSVEAVATQVLPSVVKINVIGAGGSGGSGSGVVLSTDGEILTNNHVVDVATDGGRISVNFEDGTTADAEVVGTDPVTDLAVIRAEGVTGLTPARLGDSDALDVGQQVVAVGSPYGLEATVTSGIVSSLNRPVRVGDPEQGDATIYPAVQTDAAINPGNSGGPLANMAGEVVGINSSIRTSSSALGGEGGSIGLGFAIPISKVLPIVEQLRAGEEPTHARLGVTVNGATDEGVAGAGIEEVTAGSSGDDAGLRSGDVVTRVDDEAITGTDSLIATIRGYRPGDEVELTVVRDGERLTLQATLDSDAD